MLDTTGHQGDKEFLVEVLMLSFLRHEHLVTLFGYFIAEGDQRLLVYEYMPFESVEDHIHGYGSEEERLENRKHIARPWLQTKGLAKFGLSGDMSHVSTRVMGSHDSHGYHNGG
ncbi:unnamed protein product [Brassica napus]|uniref:(rape) hypothetical protein n=1 Tax=Brassica napus TaxID=3708 RepID=A0A817AFI8_BRANA|nr:unnamed protein product [Brassica napus]